MHKLEKILKALANRRRLAILKYLKENKEAPVSEIAGKINLSFKATSKHLGVLSAIDIIERDQRSSRMFYSLSAKQEPSIKYIISILF